MSSWFKVAFAASLLTSLLFFCACGYTFNHRLSDRFNHPKGIYVPLFYNATDEVGAEMAFTNALIRKLLSHGEHVVYEESDSGLILKGTIHRISSRRENYQSIPAESSDSIYGYNRIPDQISVNAVIRLSLLETSTKKELWTQEYPGFDRVSAPLSRLADKHSPSSFGLITQSKIESSYADIARRFAASAYDGMVEIYYGKVQ